MNTLAHSARASLAFARQARLAAQPLPSRTAEAPVLRRQRSTDAGRGVAKAKVSAPGVRDRPSSAAPRPMYSSTARTEAPEYPAYARALDPRSDFAGAKHSPRRCRREPQHAETFAASSLAFAARPSRRTSALYLPPARLYALPKSPEPRPSRRRVPLCPPSDQQRYKTGHH